MHLVFERKCSYYKMRSTIAALRAFFRFVLHHSEARILELIPSLNTPRKCPEIYTPEEIELMLCVKGLRIHHRTMLMTLYAAGLRVQEVCQLKVSDIRSSRMQIRVEQNGDQKERYTPLSPELLKILRCYWRIFRPSSWLFATRNHPDRPLHSQSLDRTFHRAIKLAGLPDRGGVAALRHSFAVHSLELGVDLATLQCFLGHQWIVSTATYVHLMRTGLSGIKNPLGLLQTRITSSEGEVAV